MPASVNRGRFRAFLDVTFRLKGDDAGNVAVIFVLAAVPLFALLGGALDYGRSTLIKTQMQSALDATSITLAHEASTKTTAQLNQDAETYFNARFVEPQAENVELHLDYTSGDQELTLSADADVPTDFLGVVNIDTLPLSGSASVRWGSKGLMVALVLDNTGSMASSGKLTALKSATHNFLSKLQSAAGEEGDVYVSIIPFAKDVNLGSSNYEANWLDWTDWDSSCDSSGHHGHGHGHCSVPAHDTWTGCVVDRGNSSGPASGAYDTNVDTPTTSNKATLYVPEDYSDCPQQVLGLSYDWSAMSTLVDNMYATGNTNQALGLQAGWMSLAGGGPFTVPEISDPDAEYGRAMIILSDGLNTEDRWYSYASQIDARQELTCDNIKAAGITLYTIQVNTGSDPTSTLLQDCASDSGDFYLLTSSDQILSTLDSIATGLDSVFLSK